LQANRPVAMKRKEIQTRRSKKEDKLKIVTAQMTVEQPQVQQLPSPHLAQETTTSNFSAVQTYSSFDRLYDLPIAMKKEKLEMQTSKKQDKLKIVDLTASRTVEQPQVESILKPRLAQETTPSNLPAVQTYSSLALLYARPIAMRIGDM